MPTATITTTDPGLVEHAASIRRLGKRVVADVVEIGSRLAECKRICGHGNWLPWLEREFAWTEQTALNFMRVAELNKSKTVLDLDLSVKALYLLAAPSTPAEARDEIIERAQAGEPVSVADIKQTIDTAKGSQQPAKKRGWSRDRYKRFRARKRGGKIGTETVVAATMEDDDGDDDQTIWRRGLVYRAEQAVGRALFEDWSAFVVDDELVQLVEQAAAAWGETAAYLNRLRAEQRPASKPDDGLDIPERLRRAPAGGAS
jgi:hypothetical protein